MPAKVINFGGCDIIQCYWLFVWNSFFFFLLIRCTVFSFDNYRKDVRLPVQLQRAMAAEAEAAREARAKVIAAEGEQKASRALKEASDVISESPAGMLQEMEQFSWLFFFVYVVLCIIKIL